MWPQVIVLYQHGFSVIVCYFCCTVDRENFVVKKFVCMAAIRNLNTQNNVTFENILYQKL